ncbi:cytochrome-c peroxidase [Compostibacter hankyongensis]|uniref:Cytochrome c peroxidase n=1 Tax=Compostibacter hankyongensis TaxID=1007089 RepID=A0ABP8FBK4_9BACT
MKNVRTIAVLCLSGAALLLFSCGQRREKNGQVIERHVLGQVNRFDTFIRDSLQPAIQNGRTGPAAVQRLFLRARLLYKRFEWAAEYFAGSTTLFVNGPPVQEVSVNGPLVQAFKPAGLQVIEGYLFPRYDTAGRSALLPLLQQLRSDCEAYRAYFTHIPIADWQIFDAAKAEMFRVLTLGITGFDNPLTLHSMDESAMALESLRAVLAFYTAPADTAGLLHRIGGAVAYLRQHPDFDAFDRAAFITRYGNPVSAGIVGLEQRLHIPRIRYNRLLRQETPTLFDSGAFNVNAYAPGPEYETTRQRIALGKKLFYDAALSGNGKRSCASCHQPDKAFTDGVVKNRDIDGQGFIRRNTPTLLNAALQPALFYDLRSPTLEAQVEDVMHNKTEMHGSLVRTAQRIRQDTAYRKLMEAAYPERRGTGVDTFEVMNALASYVRSLTRLNSRFDDYMRGDTLALSRREINGFNLFMGKAKCATCHYMPLFNGTLPPKYIYSDAEVIGVPADSSGTTLDADRGWYDVVGLDAFRHAFKTPTVRNAARTAPYMHNGVFSTLEEVMDFYNKGGGQGKGLRVDNQTLSPEALHLSDTETADIIAFMKSLDSR